MELPDSNPGREHESIRPFLGHPPPSHERSIVPDEETYKPHAFAQIRWSGISAPRGHPGSYLHEVGVACLAKPPAQPAGPRISPSPPFSLKTPCLRQLTRSTPIFPTRSIDQGQSSTLVPHLCILNTKNRCAKAVEATSCLTSPFYLEPQEHRLRPTQIPHAMLRLSRAQQAGCLVVAFIPAFTVGIARICRPPAAVPNLLPRPIFDRRLPFAPPMFSTRSRPQETCT